MSGHARSPLGSRACVLALWYLAPGSWERHTFFLRLCSFTWGQTSSFEGSSLCSPMPLAPETGDAGAYLHLAQKAQLIKPRCCQVEPMGNHGKKRPGRMEALDEGPRNGTSSDKSCMSIVYYQNQENGTVTILLKKGKVWCSDYSYANLGFNFLMWFIIK